MRDGDVGRLLASVPVPGELEARQRSWQIVRAAFDVREPVPQDRPSPWRPVLALAGGFALVAALVSPPGRAVLNEVRDAIGRERVQGVRPAQPSLFSVPGGGRLLVESAAGPWIVRADGSRRLLGRYREASWSPHGVFVIATRRNELVALERDGDERWSISRPNVRHPRWGGTRTDTRVAYLSGRALRVVPGNGEGDRLVVRPVADVPPAWKPGGEHVLAYVAAAGRIRVIETATGRVTGWRQERPQQLAWSPDGSLVATRSAHEITVHTDQGLLRRRLTARARPVPGRLGSKRDAALADDVFVDAALAPDGKRLAAVVHDPSAKRSSVHVYGAEAPTNADGVVFAGAGRITDVEWSPDGEWLLIAWESADQWVFARPAGGLAKVVARSSITAQLNRGATDAPFPEIAGWCCP